MRRPITRIRVVPVALLFVAAAAGATITPKATAAGSGAIYLPYAGRNHVLHDMPPVVFSVERGFFDAPFDLTLHSPVRDALVRYTTDGSPPSLEHGATADGPLRIERTTTIRAAAFRSGWTPSSVATHTFLFLADRIRQGVSAPGFPATWGVYPEGTEKGRPVPADYAVDGRVVDDPRYAAEIVDDLKAIPSVSIVTAPDHLFHPDSGIYSHPLERGMAWERPASIEMLRTDGRPGFQVDAGVRIAGGWSRKPDTTLKHSFSVRFRSMYGPSQLDYPVFVDSDGQPEQPTRFDSLRLRGGQADTFIYFPGKAQYVHDEWGRRTQRDMGWVGARGTWVHLYLDGLYWGLYNLTEELDADFMAAHLGGKEGNWDVIRAHDTLRDRDAYDLGDGDDAAWKALLAVRDSIPAGVEIDRATYGRVAQLMDLPQHADYMLIELYADNWDWPTNNFIAARNRVLGGPFQFFVWDIEHSLGLRQSPGETYCGPCNDRLDIDTCIGKPQRCGRSIDSDGVAGLHRWLSDGSAEYRLLFADRVRRQLFEAGALSPTAAAARYDAVAGEIERAIVGESARWGDGPWQSRTRAENWRFVRFAMLDNANLNRPQNREDHWRPERARLLRDLYPHRTADLLAQLCGEGLYPAVASPRLSPPGSGAKPVTVVTIGLLDEGCADQATDGTIWFTTDGTDPRTPNAANPSPSALPYDRAIRIGDRYTRLRARQRTPDGRWSAMADAIYSRPRVAIAEINYHPVAGDDEEFVELAVPRGAGTTPIDLSGAVFTHGITATLPPGTRLTAGRPLVLARSPSAFAARYGFAPDALFTGRLADGGERITLLDTGGDTLADVTYREGDLWPLGPDGHGFSLVLRDVGPGADPIDATDPLAWRASRAAGGSPGRDDPAPPWDGRITLSEVMCASAVPYEDAVELANPSAAPVDIGGWFLSDDRGALQKYRLPAPFAIPAGGFGVIYERDFKALAPAATAFGLDSDGEPVYLSSADAAGRPTGFVQRLTCGAADGSTSFGPHRHPGGLDVAALAEPTFGVVGPVDVDAFRAGTGAPNAPPAIGPVIISEMLAAPPKGRSAWIELRNLTDRPIDLGGDPASGTGPWSLIGDVRFVFPAGAQLSANGYAVVVAVDPFDHAAAPSVPDGVPLFGPWAGRLAAASGTVALGRPRVGRTADPVLGPWVRVDGVEWRSAPPWQIPLFPTGASLERRFPAGWGNDPRSWFALRTGGSPGIAASVLSVRFIPWAQVRR
jgi:hypothetical protein